MDMDLKGPMQLPVFLLHPLQESIHAREILLRDHDLFGNQPLLYLFKEIRCIGENWRQAHGSEFGNAWCVQRNQVDRGLRCSHLSTDNLIEPSKEIGRASCR